MAPVVGAALAALLETMEAYGQQANGNGGSLGPQACGGAYTRVCNHARGHMQRKRPCCGYGRGWKGKAAGRHGVFHGT
jgi:hypothetical protein